MVDAVILGPFILHEPLVALLGRFAGPPWIVDGMGDRSGRSNVRHGRLTQDRVGPGDLTEPVSQGGDPGDVDRCRADQAQAGGADSRGLPQTTRSSARSVRWSAWDSGRDG